MRATTDEEMPLTIVSRKLDDDEATLEVMIVDVPIDPPMFEVRVLLDEERVFAVLRMVMVADAEVRLVVDAVIAERLEMVVVAKVLTPVHVLLAFIIPKVEDA